LDFSENLVSPYFCDKIAEIIMSCKNLVELCLSYCEIENDYLINIEKAMKYSTSLVELDLRNNKLTQIGKDRIILSQKQCPTLKILRLF